MRYQKTTKITKLATQSPNNTLHHDSHQYPTQQRPNTNMTTPTIYPTSTEQHLRPIGQYARSTQHPPSNTYR